MRGNLEDVAEELAGGEARGVQEGALGAQKRVVDLALHK